MSVEARLRIRHAGCWTEMITGGQHATLLGLDHERAVTVMHGKTAADVDAFVAARAADANDARVVDRSPTTVVLRCKPCVGGVVMTTFAFGCTILWPAFYRDGHEFYHVIAPSRERLGGLVSRLKEMGGVTVESVNDVTADTIPVSLPLSDITSGLTGRQLEALSVAVSHGYYDAPRRADASDLSRVLGLSRSTFQEHLRKAERQVLGRFANLLLNHPALKAAARKGVGRPRAPPRAEREAPKPRAARRAAEPA